MAGDQQNASRSDPVCDRGAQKVSGMSQAFRIEAGRFGSAVV